MKKLIRNITLLIIGCTFLFVLNSCNKEKDIISKDKTNSNITKPILKKQSLRFLWSWPILDAYGKIIGYYNIFCAWPSGNCLSTVTINSVAHHEVIAAYRDFIDHFNSGTVNEFFTDGNYLALFPELEEMPDVVKGLSNSEILLYSGSGQKDDPLDYYIGLPKDVSYNSDWKDQEKCVLVIDNQLK